MRLRGAHHQGIAADIDVGVGQVVAVFADRVVDEAGAARPKGRELRQDRREGKPGQARGPFCRQIRQIDILAGAGAPVEMHRPAVAGVDRRLDDGFDRRKAGTAREQDDGPVRGAQIEVAVGQLDLQGIAERQF
jgi:hypothetical protein